MKRGDTRDQIKGVNPVMPAGEWNRYEIRCQDSLLGLVVNGVPTSHWQGVQVLKGYIGLKAEGYAIEFKNLRIKELQRPLRLRSFLPGPRASLPFIRAKDNNAMIF